MSWPAQVVDNMAMLKAAGYGFVESWETTLELFPQRLRYGQAPSLHLFEADNAAADLTLEEFAKARCWEAWHGLRPDLVEVANAVSELFGLERGVAAQGKSVAAPLGGS